MSRHSKDITAIIDTREQLPLDLESHGLKIVYEALSFGDYSLHYPRLSDHICIERKSLQDFVACCGKERKRFFRELLAMRGYRYKAIVIEAEFEEIRSGS